MYQLVTKCVLFSCTISATNNVRPPILTSGLLSLQSAQETLVGLHVKFLFLCLYLQQTGIRPLI